MAREILNEPCPECGGDYTYRVHGKRHCRRCGEVA